MTLSEYIEEIFGEDGLICKLGGRYTKEQKLYALAVTECLEKNLVIDEKTLGLLQADTGIGKSLGYLIPIALYILLNDDFGEKKIIVSTYTRHLQKQIFDKDFPFVLKVMGELGFNSSKLKIAYRMGKQAFFSVNRTELKCKEIKAKEPENTDEIDAFFSYVVDLCEFGSGLWMDYLEDFVNFPLGIKIEDICLINSEKETTNSYKEHLKKVKDANIIISNHQSCILPDRTGISDFDIHAMIFDEAHKIAGICFDNFNYRLNLNDVKSTVKKIGSYFNVKSKCDTACDKIDKIESIIQSSRNFNDIVYISETNHGMMFNEVKAIVSDLLFDVSNINKLILRKVGDDINVEESILLEDIDLIINRVNNWVKQNSEYTVSAIGLSEIRKEVSLAYLNINASKLFGVITKKLTDRILLTSATLSSAKNIEDFNISKSVLGLKSVSNTVELIVSPQKYANMNFVLMGKDCPSPIVSIDDKAIEFNKDWLKETRKMILEAAKSNSLLILTNSYYESEIIFNLIKDLNPILHKRKTMLKEYLADFQVGDRILISCAAWEGLDIRKSNGDQLIKNLLITRIPYSPPNAIIDFALKVYSKKEVKTQSELKSLQWVFTMQDVVSKLKQGLGRGTRGPDDDLLVWFADPRMPSLTTKTNKIILNSIPKRFMENYYKARVFSDKPQKEKFFI